MLYDILFIDDDFDKQADSETWNSNAQKLFLEFVRDNLKVTYTTGELDDLKKLGDKDLSCIKYIFCDLHLMGISDESTVANRKEIISKLIGIFKNLAENIKSPKITVFINSKFSKEWPDTKKDLEGALREKDLARYSVVLIKEKNKLSDPNKQQLLKENLDFYLKSLIINKAIEVERVFDKKLKLSPTSKEKITFESKFYVLQSQFKLEATIKSQLQLLQQIRNKLAHTDNDFSTIKDESMKKKFWKICSEQESTDNIEFKDFNQLMKYIESIDELIEKMRNVVEKKH